ncbi:MAG: hypothetical protein WDK95_05535 [Syntrophorhabdaceae bacterium]
MKKNWKKWLMNILLGLSLFSVGIWISGNYDYAFDDDGVFLGISVVILVSYLWKKIDNKFFKQ